MVLQLEKVGYYPGVVAVLHVGIFMGNLVQDLIERIRAHQEELRAAGVVSLALFGSVARDEATGGLGCRSGSYAR